MQHKRFSLVATQVGVVVLATLLIAAVAILPYLVRTYLLVARHDALYQPLLICLYATSGPGVAVLALVWALLRNIQKKAVFVRANVRILRGLAWCFVAVTLCFLGLGWFYHMSFVVAVAVFFFAMVLRVLRHVFEQACDLQQDNDYTI